MKKQEPRDGPEKFRHIFLISIIKKGARPKAPTYTMAEAQQLQQIEAAVTQLYQSEHQDARNQADAALAGMFGSGNVSSTSTTVATHIVTGQGIASNAAAADISAIPRHEFVLSKSVNTFALHFSSQALLRIVSSCWQSLNTEQRIQLRDFAFNCFVAKGPQLNKLAVSSLITLTCRITKRGWCDSPQYHLVVTEMLSLLKNTNPFYQRLGLTFLHELIQEMQVIRVQGRNGSRSASIAFLVSLREIFVQVKRLLQSLAPDAYEFDEGSDEEEFLELALKTVLSCLSYDFDVSNPDRSTADITTTRAPRSWTDTRDETTIGLFFEIYNARQNTTSASLALECIGKCASLRRSLFSADERHHLIQRLQRETLSIMTSTGTNGTSTLWGNDETLHSFCRLLGSLKLSFHLDEVVKPESYGPWIQALFHFSIQAFKKWDVVDDTALGYILSLWGALVHPLVDGAKEARQRILNASKLGEMVPPLMSAYVQSRMEMAAAIAHTKVGDSTGRGVGIDNPLEQEGVPAQMVPIEQLSWLKYIDMAQFLTNLLDTHTNQLIQASRGVTASNGSNNEANVALAVAESRLSWLVQISASVVGAFASNVWTRLTVPDNVNAELTSRTFRLMILICPHCANQVAYNHALQHFNSNNNNSSNPGANTIRPSPLRDQLELSFLEFIDQFRKLHIQPDESAKKSTNGRGSRLSRSKAILVQSLVSRTIPGMLARKIAKAREDTSMEEEEDDAMLSGGNKGGDETMDGGQSEQREANTYTQLVHMIGMNQQPLPSADGSTPVNNKQHIAVLDVVISKLAFNLRAWSPTGQLGTTSTVLAKRTLLVLHSMASGVKSSRVSRLKGPVGFSTGEMLLQSRVLCNLLDNADINPISYFASPKNGSERTVFFNALSHLLYMQMSNTAANLRFSLFIRFVRPLEKVSEAMFTFVAAGNSLRNPGIRTALAGWCRDVLGVCTASKTRGNYSLLFDWLVDTPKKGKPSKLQLLSAALKAWSDDPFVTTPILKLIMDLVHNRTHRIVFAPSKASGYILCRLAAQCVTSYVAALMPGAPLPMGAPTPPSGSHVGIGLNPGENIYKKRYKGLGLCMHILAHLLNGTYVNFGIMELYGDTTLSSARDSVLKLILQSDPNDILSYPKTTNAFFMLMDALAEKDIHAIVQLPSPMFISLMTCVKIVLERPVEEATYAASIVNRLVTYRYSCQQSSSPSTAESASSSVSSSIASLQKKKEGWQHFVTHHNHSPTMFDQILITIFQQVCFKHCPRLWSMSRPLLPLILNSADHFRQYKQQVLSQAPQGRAQVYQLAFSKLDEDIQDTLSSKNRDRFTKNLYAAVKMIRE